MLKSLKFFRKVKQKYLILNKKISYLKFNVKIKFNIDNTTILLNYMFNKIVAKEYYQIYKYKKLYLQARNKDPK